MPYQQRKPRSFGADDTPVCPNYIMPKSQAHVANEKYSLIGPAITSNRLPTSNSAALAHVS